MEAKQVRSGFVRIGLGADELRTFRQVLNEVFNGIGFANLDTGEPLEIGSAERLRRLLAPEADSAGHRPDIHGVLMRSDDARNLLLLSNAVRAFIGDEELHTRVGLTPAEYGALVDQLRGVVQLQQ